MSGSHETNRIRRRSFFESIGAGVYGSALASILKDDLGAEETLTASEASESKSGRGGYDLKPRLPHFEPKATSVIHLFMNGGPSQMDLLDPKPELDRRHGSDYFKQIAGELESPTAAGTLIRSPYKFNRHGECGMEVSELMPHLAKRVDDIAFLRGMFTTNLTHEPALFKIHSGRMLPGLPSIGSWVSYALGTENQNLPAYVVLTDPLGLPVNRDQSWQSGFLPPIYQGTRFRPTGTPILNLSREFDEPDSVTSIERDFIARLDRRHQKSRFGQPQLGARIASYELAARMQLAASDAIDFSKESPKTLEMYGVGKKPTDSYARRCLIARRLVERGVRFVQLYINFQIWDHHTEIEKGLKKTCAYTDQPVAALLKDLSDRGLLDRTLVVWGGEFGRLPIAQLRGDRSYKNAGRDHNKNAMISWMAGGGVKGGTIHGATDDLGFAAVENKTSVPDFHATILHQLGLHHEDVFFERNGLKERLTATFEARVVKEILA